MSDERIPIRKFKYHLFSQKPNTYQQTSQYRISSDRGYCTSLAFFHRFLPKNIEGFFYYLVEYWMKEEEISLKIKDCRDDHLAVLIKKLPLLSLRLGHKKISSSVKGYISPGENDVEAEFVLDLFSLSTEEIIEKWYGGEEEAFQLMAQIEEIENID